MMCDVIYVSASSPPLADWISSAARAVFAQLAAQPPVPIGDIAATRTHYDAINSARLEVALHRYPVSVTQRRIGNVAVQDVVPDAAGPGVLLCLHGGAFQWGSGAAAVLEAVPVAALSGMRVLAVEYRLAPEHRYPAAVNDVMDVIAALRQGGDDALGIYGCSAGGVLTTQVTARMVDAGLPPPRAIAMLHGAGVDVGGDSLATAALLNGTPAAADLRRLHDLPYFAGTAPTDPLVFPGESAQMLRAFPPSLLITGTRDFAASSVSVMHRRLLAAGVDARFVLFDGMWHAHHVDTDLPEAAETHAILAEFFRRHVAGTDARGRHGR